MNGGIRSIPPGLMPPHPAMALECPALDSGKSQGAVLWPAGCRTNAADLSGLLGASVESAMTGATG